MRYQRLTFITLLVALVTGPLAAQVELNPYVGRPTDRAELFVVGPADQTERFAGRGYILGVDALFGRRQLVPLLGLTYQRVRYRGDAPGSDFRGDRLLLPLGAAYRLRPADTSFNLLLRAALGPALETDGADRPSGVTETKVRLHGRLGATLYLDMFSLGVDYYPAFSGDYLGAGRSAAFTAFTLGGRF